MRAILTYHSVDESGSPISVSGAAFEAHRRWLTSGAIRNTSLAGILSSPDDGQHEVAVTFDDGVANIRTPLELLLDAGIKPTVFVVTGHVGGTNAWGGRDHPGIPRLPLLTWDELGDLSRRGVAIEAHSRTHPSLTGLSSTELEEELGGCSDDLLKHLGVRATAVAYPYGYLNPVVVTCAARWFAHGVTTEMAPLATNSQSMLLPRLDMYYYREPRAIESWGSSGFKVRLNLIALRRRIKAAMTRRGAR
jgi:peptidoglycan/xylan/chitin deacetylase (PgdA/CDA1 family)